MAVKSNICSIFAPVTLVSAAIFAVCLALGAHGQRIVDRTMVIVSDNSGSPQLITYSDAVWQLALEPATPLSPPSPDDIARALETLVKQRLFALEADRLPQAAPTDAEIASEIRDILSQFNSPAEFEARLRAVGFDSVKDENFERLMTERVRIKKYIDFRFRSFVIVTQEDEQRYFQDFALPEFRKRFVGTTEPTFASRRAQINRILVERSVADSIEAFLDEAERTAEIVYLTVN